LKEKMSPPSMAEISQTYSALWTRITRPDRILPELLEGANVRKFQEAGWQPFVKAGLGGLELFGFFCIGEIIGRRSIKGYDV
jgi:F-type H+-transporting ATPase subunit g